MYISFITIFFTTISAVTFDCSLCGISDCETCLDYEKWHKINRKESSLMLGNIGNSSRKMIWLKNRNKIMTHNAKRDKTYTMSLNRFADMTHAEFRKERLMNQIQINQTSLNRDSRIASLILPFPYRLFRDRQIHMGLRSKLDGVQPINWLINGAVPQVLDQGQCGSCWAFSAYETISAHYAIKFNQSAPTLSPQELIDCVPANYNCYGCSGGIPALAMQYVLDSLNNGLERYNTYPYTGQNGNCNRNNLNLTLIVNASRVINISTGSQRELLYVLANNGPVSVCIDASSPGFQFYSHGIYSDTTCSSDNVNHAVLLYGLYRDSNTGRWAYMVRNSWGEDTGGNDNGWGIDGDIFMDAELNNGNMCGIASLASALI